MRTVILFLFLVTAVIAVADNISDRAGTAGGLVAEIGANAKGIALGDANVGNFGHADAYYWNAGATGFADKIRVSFTHVEWLISTRMEHISAVFPVGKFGTIGINANYMNYGDVIRTVENSDGTYQKEDGTFSGRDIIGGLTLGTGITLDNKTGFALGNKLGNAGNLGFGIAINYIRSDYDNIPANTVNFGLGLLYFTPVKELTLGASVKNLGPKIKFIEKSYDQPLTGRVGVRYGILNNMVIVLSDVIIPSYQYPSIGVGVEVNPIKYVSLRAGYKYQYGVTGSRLIDGISGGVGINLPQALIKFGDISLDYAFVQYTDLGLTHRISLEVGFGGQEEKKK